MEKRLRSWRNACFQIWNNSTCCHWQLEVQHHSFIILFGSWYSCRGDKWEHISASFMWKKLMIRLHEFISVGHLYASQAVHVCMWGHSEVSRLHCWPRSRSNASNRNLNPSAWGHLNPSSYCDVGRLFYGVFKLWSKLQRKKMKK